MKQTYRDATPFTAHARQTLSRPARLLAVHTFRVAGQVAFPPVMVLYNMLLSATQRKVK